MIKTFNDILRIAKKMEPKIISVAVAEDKEVLTAVSNAKLAGIADAILIGNKEEIIKVAYQHDIDIRNFEIINIQDKTEACHKAVGLVCAGKAHLVMKGLVDTSVLLKAVLDEKTGLRTGNVLSHVAVFEVEGYDWLFYVTDAAMNIAPDLNKKKQIIENAIMMAHSMGNKNPKVAVLAAVEKVNLNMQATLDAAELIKMNENGKIAGCILGGPFALDIAISTNAAKHKGIDHPVAGRADVLMVPSIESGNLLYKSMVYFAKAKNAGIIVGAKAPVVLTSRADSDEAKLYSIAIGVMMASAKKFINL